MNMLQPMRRFFGFSTLLKMRLIVPLVVVCSMACVVNRMAQAQTPPVGPFVYVTNSSAGTVSVIDTSTNAVVQTITLCGAELCSPGPAGLAVTPGGKFVYVANKGNGTVSVIATSSNTVVATIPMPACDCASSSPAGVAITPDGTRAYVTDITRFAIQVIDTNPNDGPGSPYNTVTATITLGTLGVGSPNGPIAITPDGSAAFYTFNSDGFVGRIDTNPASESYNTHTTSLTVGNNPTGIAITPNGAFIYVANNTNNTVSVIPNPNFAPIATVSSLSGSAPGSIAITPDGKTAYVVDQGGSGNVSVISTATNTVGTPVSGLCATLNQIAITSDGQQAYVADAECDKADVINTATNMLKTPPQVPVGSGPFGVAASGSQTKTLGPPGTTIIFTFNTDTYKLTGVTNQGGEVVTVEALLVPASQFPTFTSFPNETCIPYGDYSSGGVDMCVEFQVHCQFSSTDTTPCNFIYLVATGYDLPADLSGGIGGPDLLVAHGVDGPLTSSSNVQSIFLSYEANIKDPTTRGGSRGPSVFVATRTKNATPITSGTSTRLVGWESPVVDTDLNQVRAGSTRPLKFQFFDTLGNPVTNLSLCNSFSFNSVTGANVCNDAPTVPTPWVNLAAFGIPCPNGFPVNPATDTSLDSSGGSGLQNLGGGSYQFNWKTMKSWRGACANVAVTFDSTLAKVPAMQGFQFN
jgi:YVTN family beta-propeller protein